MTIWHVIILAIVQGLTELLPVSSSAHVVVAEKLMHLNPSRPDMTLLLVMLHTGTMFAVVVYFWNDWRAIFWSQYEELKHFLVDVILATVLTAVVGGGLVFLIEHTLYKHQQKAEVEQLFSHLELIAPALLAVGILSVIAGWWTRNHDPEGELTTRDAGIIGVVQGLCLPFRGFSRSGATISTSLLLGVERHRAEAFSFALAVVITPPALFREVNRLLKASVIATRMTEGLAMGLIGMCCAFVAGLLALKWLSDWLETGRWYVFGIYCIVASAVVFGLWRAGY